MPLSNDRKADIGAESVHCQPLKGVLGDVARDSQKMARGVCEDTAGDENASLCVAPRSVQSARRRNLGNVLGELAQSGDPDAILDNMSSVDLDSAGANPGPEDNLDQDFGLRGTGVLADTVFFDVDGDGSQDAGE